jgi:hypothetical protein
MMRTREESMNKIIIRKTVDSDTLHVPELKSLIGKEIEITIRETTQPNVDRFAILEEIAQQNLIDFEAYRQYDADEWAFAREACK